MVKKNLMDIVTMSGVRKELLLFLDDGPRSLSEIKDRFDMTAPEVSPRIKELIEHHLILYEGKKYYLTAKGKTIVKNFKPFVDTINIFNQYGDWWDEHDLSSIPDGLLYRIGELKNYFIIEDDSNNDERTKVEMSNIINNSNSLVGITCTFNDEYPDQFLNLAKNNVPTNIIITDKIYNMIEKQFMNELCQFSNIDNSGIYVSNDNLRVSEIVSDNCLFFSLAYINGKLDLQTNLVSYDPSSIKWGLDLFEYYKSRSKKI